MSIPRTPENTFERPEGLQPAPHAPRALRRVPVVRPEVPVRAQGAPGQFSGDYEALSLERSRTRRGDRSPSHRNRAVAAYTGAAIALMTLGGLADRAVQSSNHSAVVAGELQQSASGAAQELLDHGADGVVLVPVTEGEKVSTITNQIANSSSTGEVADILEDQQDGSNVINGNTVAAVPAGDLTTSALQKLPDHGQVTAQGLAELQGNGNQQ